MKIGAYIATFAILLVALVIYAATPSQILSSAAAFQGNSDRDLRISSTFLLAQLAGLSSPSIILSNAASFQGVPDRQLMEAQTYLLANLTAGILIKSNTLASIPTLNPGDAYLWNSNGVLFSINSSISGTLTTNKLAP